MAREDYTNFMEKTIYDLAVQAGYTLKRADKTQVSRLIEVFQSEPDPIDSISLLMLYIMRQSKRNELPREAHKLIEHLHKILGFGKDDKNTLRKATLKYLTLTKWIYETEPPKEYKSLDEYIQSFSKAEGRY